MKHILTVLTVLVAALAAVAQQQDFGQMDFAALLQQADGGNAEAQYELAERYKRGVGGAEKNGARAAHYYELSAGQDYPQAMFGLGMCYLTGFGKERDFEQGIMWVRRAANRGVVDAMLILGSCYEEGGFGLPKDGRQAAYWYGKAAEQGNADGQNSLGRCYIMGTGVEKDTVMAVECYRKSAEQGYAIAQYNLGGCYEKGAGVAKDLVKAVEWIRKSAEQGYAPAQYSLGLCYENGIVVEKNLAQAVEWYRKAAEQGHAEAQYALGRCLENGIGVGKKNPTEAVKWYRKAAEKGHVEAQYALGCCLENGIGVEKANPIEALKWYQKAADKGLAEAQYALGRCYENGIGIGEKLLAEAVYWYRKAAEQDYAPAQYALGRCLENGRGVKEKDPVEAMKWYSKAAEQGFEKAKAAVERLKNAGTGAGNQATGDPGGGGNKTPGNRGSGGSRDDNSNVELPDGFEEQLKLAKQGNSHAQAYVGYCYWTVGYYAQAVYWLEKAAARGDIDGCYFLGLCYYHGQGVVVDYVRAVQLFDKPATSRNYDNIENKTNAQYHIATCYDDGMGEVRQDQSKAALYYRMAAELGYAPAQSRLGAMYSNGTGVPRNYTEALKWLELAVAQGDIIAKYNLGLCYYFGRGVSASTESDRQKNYAVAYRLFKDVAEAEGMDDVYYSALGMLGQCYLFGRGVAQDSRKAYGCFLESGRDGNNANAQYYLGMFYYTGRDNVVTVDYRIAVEWFTKSANQGVAAAQYELGRCCLYGVGTTKNRENAKVLLEAAAKAGDKNAKKLYEEEFLNKVQEL